MDAADDRYLQLLLKLLQGESEYPILLEIHTLVEVVWSKSMFFRHNQHTSKIN